MAKSSPISAHRRAPGAAPFSPCSDHFEDLLDRLASAGMLGEEEWGRLQDHLAQCPPCGMQVRSPARLQDVRLSSASAAATDAQLDRRAIQSVLLRSEARPRRPAPARHSLIRRWAPVGVGTLLLSGTTLAATWWSNHREPELVMAGGPAPESPGRPTSRVAGRKTGASAFGLSSSLASTGGGAPAPGALTAPDSAPRPAPPLEAAVASTSPASSSSSSPGDGTGAERLFSRARRQRIGGHIEQALTIYERLQREFPGSRESRLSYLVAGRLWLERDRPDLAATQFRQYLDSEPDHPEGGASEEALLGHASALGRMHRLAEEARDWRRLLAEHPGSVYATRARDRLAELETNRGRRSGSEADGPRRTP